MSRRVRTAASIASLIAVTTGGALAVPPLAVSAPGSLAPLAMCDGPAPRVTEFGDAAAPVLGWRENLVFDGRGRMWVSNVVTGEVVGYDAAGQRVAAVRIGTPGGLAVTPSGEVVVVTGSLVISPNSQIFAFDPDDDAPAPRLVATLPAGKNGLAVDPDGNMYTTGLLAPNVTKVRPDGSVDRAWSAAAAIGGTNGIVISGDTAYVGVTLSTDTAVYEMPLADPAAARLLAQTRLPEVPRGLDDLAVTRDAVYAAGLTGGEIIRVDRATGASCVAVGGIPGPTSVRVTEGFGEYGPSDLFVTAIDGQIRHVATG